MSVSVSVVIPMYRARPWIEATLESVLQQTYPADKIEIIAIDDASPDDSAEMAARFLARQGREGRIVRQEKNGGVPVARNTGWRLAKGDWIQFLDQDDLLRPHKVELQAQAAASAPDDVAVVYSNWQHLLLEEGKWRASGPINAPYVSDQPLLQILEQFSFGYVGPTLIRKSFLEKIDGFSLKPNLGEDCDLMMRLAMVGAQFLDAPSKSAAFLYRQSPGSLWRTYIKNQVAMRNLLDSFRDVEHFWRRQSPGGQLSTRQREALARRYSRFADFYVIHDPETYQQMKTWLAALGFERPVGLSPRLHALSRFVGFEQAVKLRAGFWKVRSSLRAPR